MAKKENKNNFLIYHNWSTILKNLDETLAGKLIQAICRFQDGEDVKIEDVVLNSVFLMIKEKMLEDKEAYEEKCKVNSENASKAGKKSAESKKRDFACESNQAKENENESKRTDVTASERLKSDTVANSCQQDTDTDTVFKREVVKKAYAFSSSSTTSLSKSVQKIVEEWNKLSSLGIKEISKVGGGTQREKQLHARLKQYSENDVLHAISNIRESRFLRGNNKQGWMITFDWFVKPNNFPKVLEGNYDDKNVAEKVDDKGGGGEGESKWNIEHLYAKITDEDRRLYGD